jgi:primosomal protein N' (replication factor Y)
VEKYERQTEVLMAFTLLSRAQPFVRKKELLSKAGASEAVLQGLVKKGIFETYEREISRIAGYEDEFEEARALSAAQEKALQGIRSLFAEKPVVLLHGVTGSGKTQLYIELIRETIRQGGQALYLLPEIALTSQIIQRLQRVFGSDVTVYHSRVNYNERVEIWKSAAAGKPVMLGARSSLFLPFRNLQLIIVDEEHDNSFKQYDPAPRYNARDTAIYLAGLYGAKTLLGTATPSLETWFNAQTGKYGLATLPERFGGLQLPEIRAIDLREQFKTRQMQGLFSPPLLDGIKSALANGEQVILFQNRRGYAPILECQVCGWSAMCKHCEVSLTYHKLTHRLRCHYCGYQEHTPSTCPACGSGKVGMMGFGTEKIEDELKIYLPEARVDRLDLDTASSRINLSAILQRFEEKETDILVGTQMVTKGLDFDNVGLVGVLRAGSMLKFPDFRSGERTYQLLTQVAGRAGRKHKRGLVLVQAIHPQHPVLQEVFRGDYLEFAQRELQERQQFHYPPFSRLIHLTIEHKDEKTAHHAAAYYGEALRRRLGDRVLGPVIPQIPRLRGYYGHSILLKMEKNAHIIAAAKDLIKQLGETVHAHAGWSGVKIRVDVDPG